MKTTHVIVEGLVQGVFFRDYTCRQALKLHLTGWVQNLPDRTVEVLIQGEPSAIESMLTWLEKGSPRSTVKKLNVQKIETTEQVSTFEVRY